MSDLNIRQLVVGPLEENTYLVWREGREDAFLVDAGDDLAIIERAVKLSGKKLTDILLTHGHFDHILSAASLAKAHGARIHIHPQDAHMLKDASASLYQAMWCNLPFTPIEADALYPDGDEAWTLDVCGVSFTGLRTAGHTKGSVCLLDAEHKVLFTGDTLFAYGCGRTDFPGGSDAEMGASLARLLKMDGALTVYSGHGQADGMSAIARRWRR